MSSGAQLNKDPKMEDILASIKKIIYNEERSSKVRENVNEDNNIVENITQPLEKQVKDNSFVENKVTALVNNDKDISTSSFFIEQSIEEDKNGNQAVKKADTNISKHEEFKINSSENDKRKNDMVTETSSLQRAADEIFKKSDFSSSAKEVTTISSEKNADQISSIFQQLVKTVLSSDDKAMEKIVTEMLRPMLKAWINENLPFLVERVVREEVEKLSRR